MKTVCSFIFVWMLSALTYAQVPMIGMLGGWPFSGNANDISGFGNHGTVNGATLIHDRCGNPNSAYRFNGTNNYISTLLTGPTGTLSRSVSFWARTTNTLINSPVSVFDYGTAVAPGSRFQITWNSCAAGVGLDVTNQSYIRGNNCLLNNQWHHVVITYDETLSTQYGSTSLYIDGVLQAVTACSNIGINQAINTGTVYPITIGASGSQGVFNRFWQGDLDDIFLYNRPLTAGEVLQLYSACPPPMFGNVLVCGGSVNVYSIAPLSNASYTWNLPAGWTGASTNNTISVTVNSSGTIGVVASSTCGSFGSSTLAVNVSIPVHSYTSTVNCASTGAASISTTGGAGPYTYTWSPPVQTGSVATGLVPGTYSVTVFDAGLSCSSVSLHTFNSPLPFSGTLSATSSLPCFGVNTGSAAISLSGGSGIQTYSWTGSAGTQTQATASLLGIGNYTVKVTDVISSCSTTHTFQITQPQPLSMTITPSATMACTGSTIAVAALNYGGTAPHTYTWTNGPASSFYAPTEAAGGAYVYTVTGTDANGCSITSTVGLTFVDFPKPIVTSTSICSGGAATLSASGAQSYLWYPGGFTGSSVILFPQVTTVYTVSANTLGCISTTVASVVVNSLPVPVISVNNNICVGQPITLGSGGGTLYLWSGPNNFSCAVANTVISSSSASNAGVYSVTVTDANGCTAGTSTFVPVLPNPVPSVGGASVCIGEAATMTVSGGVNYLWSGPSGFTSTVQSLIVPVVTANNAGAYTVYVTGANSCVAGAVVQLVAYPYPLPSPTIVARPGTCLNTPVSIAGAGGDSYLWTGPGNFSSVSPTLNFVPDNTGMSGIYTLTVKNTSNCAASATVNITIFPLPSATVVADKNKMCVPFCAGFSLEVSPASIAPVKGFYFLNAPGPFSNSVIVNCFTEPGDKLLFANYIDTNNCVNSATLLVNAYPKPHADFDFYPPQPKANSDLVKLSNFSQSTKVSEWTWYFENDSVPVKEASPVHIFNFPDNFPVVLIVKNSYGCRDTVIKVIAVSDDISVYVPNVFTPNGDGLNEVFQPIASGIDKYNLEVFDRWGRKVFSTNDINKPWDGSYRGELSKMDTYVWSIRVVSPVGVEKSFTGTVLMTR